MKKSYWWVIGIIIVAAIVVSISGNTKNETGPIKIGFIGPLSGDAAAYGETEKNATDLAVGEINKAGGINGRQLNVVYEDGRCTGKDATIAIQKLISVDKVKVVLGGTCSGESLAAVPIATQNHIVLLSAFSSNPQLSGISPYFFRNGPSDSDVTKLDASFLISKYKAVAVLTENTDYTQGVRSIMKNLLASSTVSVVSDEVFGSANAPVTDFRTIIQRVKSTNPDAIYVNANAGKTGGLIIKQIRQSGWSVPIYGNFVLGTPDAIAVGGKYMEGVIMSSNTQTSQKLNGLLNESQIKFGSKATNDFEFGSAYDRVYILAKAIKAVGYDSEKIRQYLSTMPNFEGVVGTYRYDSNGDVVGGSFFQENIIKDGKGIPITN
jgi:branched-chain amino acid transport system substrate-binding protein